MDMDIWFTILSKMNSWRDVLKMRRTERLANDAFYHMVQSCRICTCAQRTFIQSNVCMCCEKYCDNLHHIVYTQDQHPLRRLHYCDSLPCFLASFRCYVNDSNRDMIYPYAKIPNEYVWIPRSQQGFSLGKITGNVIVLHNNTPHIKVVFSKEVYDHPNLSLDKAHMAHDIEQTFVYTKLAHASVSNNIVVNKWFCRLFAFDYTSLI